ncbi:MAG: hypothetical protein FJ241_01800 [Nitrospira sp.]|nr:hypothetical protein [Nitrospira sp.]
MNISFGELLKQNRLRKVLYLLFFTIVIGLIVFILRGPYISNALKRIILPELESASGQRVIAQKIYINIFPLFIEAKGLKVFDENGNKILFAKRVKGYIDLTDLVYRQIAIRRLVIKDTETSTNREQLKGIIKNVITYLEKERKPFIKVRIKAIEASDGIALIKDDSLKILLNIKGFGGEILLGQLPRLKTSIKEFTLKKEGWSDLKGKLNASAVFRENGIEIKTLDISSYGSEFKGIGLYSEGKGTFQTEIALLVDSVKKLFNLKQRGEGRIYAKGELKTQNSKLKTQNLKDISLNLKLKGDFYLQTLMELLRVKEKVEGLVDFQGEIKGNLTDLSGRAKARLRKGNLFDIEVDSLRCDVLYQDRIMSFENGVGELYHGKAQAEASFNLPSPDAYTLDVKFNSVDSSAALKLIRWEPEIPEGKVNGELFTSGSKFNPDGWFAYEVENTPSLTLPPRGGGQGGGGDNVMGRIRNIKGNYSLRDHILYLSNLKINTPLSNISVEGTVNLTEKTLSLNSILNTDEVSDLTLPYYNGLKGAGYFSGAIGGTFDHPEVAGSVRMSNAFIEGHKADSITSEFSYNKNLLRIQEMVATVAGGEQRIKGSIFFPQAEKLFELAHPVYEINASSTNIDVREITKIFSQDISAAGRLNADFRIGGKDKDISIEGNAFIEKAVIFQVPVDSVSTAFSYMNKEISFRQAIIKRGSSTLKAEGKISSDEKFSFRASSDRLITRDLGLKHIPDDIVFSVQSEGQGTFKDPLIRVNAQVLEGTYKGRPIGQGSILAEIKNRDIVLNASLLNEKVKIRGNGQLNDDLPWTAEIDIQQGRYDFIVSSVLKDIPEDLQLILRGHVTMKGDRKNITALAHLNHLTLSLFGYSFSNDSDIKIQIHNKKLSFPAFGIKNGGTSFKLSGGMEIGKEYNIHLVGSSSLLLLKGLSKRISYLRGDTDFAFSITGNWEKPEINGGVNVSNASFGIKNYYSYMSSINGYLSLEKDRIVVQRLSGKLGGGNIDITGFVYLKAFTIKGFYLEANLDNISTSPSKDVSLNFGGNLLYKGTLDKQSITGDIKINRARYKKRVEWKIWLLMAKEKPKTEVSKVENTELNIRVSGSDNISIDNNIARASLKIDMVLRGTISRPVLFGRLESKGGYVYFRNNEFRIINASADFTDPYAFKPIIRLTAETLAKGYNIRLNLEGEMNRFNLSMSSDPPLEETDILALLTVGQVGKQLKGLEGGIGAGEATSFLTGKIQDVLEERFRTLTGIDRLQVDPYVSRTTGTIGPRVTVSKKLIGDRLLVTYTTLLGSTEEQILKLEYILAKNISLIGMRDEKGSAGGDIKFRFEFK